MCDVKVYGLSFCLNACLRAPYITVTWTFCGGLVTYYGSVGFGFRHTELRFCLLKGGGYGCVMSKSVV